MTAVPLLLCDIDGTVRQGKDDALGRFVNGPGDVHVFPDAVIRLTQWRDAGGRAVGVSNQGGIALGLVTAADVDAAFTETLRQASDEHGELLDAISYCTHYPTVRACWCRKPHPGAIIRAVSHLEAINPGEEYPPDLAAFVGDRDEDEQCAAAAGVRFVPAPDWRSGLVTLT